MNPAIQMLKLLKKPYAAWGAYLNMYDVLVCHINLESGNIASFVVAVPFKTPCRHFSIKIH